MEKERAGRSFANCGSDGHRERARCLPVPHTPTKPSTSHNRIMRHRKKEGQAYPSTGSQRGSRAGPLRVAAPLSVARLRGKFASESGGQETSLERSSTSLERAHEEATGSKKRTPGGCPCRCGPTLRLSRSFGNEHGRTPGRPGRG